MSFRWSSNFPNVPPELRNRFDGETVDEIVHRVSAVTLDPLEVGALVFRKRQIQLDQLIPEIRIRDGFALGIPPTVRLPLDPPAVPEAMDHVCGIADDDQSLRFIARDRTIDANGFDCSRQFHALIRGSHLTTAAALFSIRRNSPCPASRARITATCPIGVDNDSRGELANRRIHERFMFAHRRNVR